VGRLTEAKGLDILMQAMQQIGSSRPWNLLLLGSGEYQDKVLAWAASLGWRDRVKIKLALHADVPRYLGSMDLLAAPSQTRKNWKEQFGRMIVEAFACGVPVIGSDSGEIPYVIGDAGRVVGETDVAGWAQAIQQLLDDARDRDQLRERGLARAPRYSVIAIAEQYRAYFRWLAARPERMVSWAS
jgi:phosphatidyl-myo-inositol dimannoside synthase